MAINHDNPEKSNAADRFEIAIMAKAPIAGYAKTRLIPVLGAGGAADLQDWLLRRTVATAIASKVGPVSLWCAPDCDHPAFRDCSDLGALKRYRQPEGDLGVRMRMAAGREMGVLGTVIVGTDCPTLVPTDFLKASLAIQEGSDASVIPADDGGYVLIAVRQAYAELFSEIDWGTSRVMAQTRHRAREAGIQLVEFAPKWDVDLAEDFARLVSTFPELRKRFAGWEKNETVSTQEKVCR